MRTRASTRWAVWTALGMPIAAFWPTSAVAQTPTEAAPSAAPAPAPAPPAAAKDAPKPAAAASTTKTKPKPREAKSKPGKPDQGVRNILRGEHPEHSTAEPQESPELKSMRELDNVLFPPSTASAAPWDNALALEPAGPKLDATGMPSASDGTAPPATATPEPAKDLSWLATLEKPDFPARLEASVVRYLEFYKDDPRGQSLVASFVRKSGKFRKRIVELARSYKLPEDLLWLVAVESAFDPAIHSHAGAAGLWQFMPATGRIYGLTVNRRIDERLDPERATHAALKHLSDLYRRFGTWELAFAAYNMGYGGLLASIRKYNTNDYWELRRLEAGLPYETALYVPKIIALAYAAKNCKLFGCDKQPPDAAEKFGDEGQAKAAAAPGMTLEEIAEAIDVKADDLVALNPHVIGSRLPPLQQSSLPRKSWTVYVPKSKAKTAADKLPAAAAAQSLGKHTVRWGETIAAIAAAYGTSVGHLETLNDLVPHESPRPESVVFVPRGRGPKPDADIQQQVAGVAVVPDRGFSYPDRRRVFYDVIFGDTLEDIGRVTGAKVGDIRRWNHIEGRAKLQDGMRLQLFLPKAHRPQNVFVIEAPQLVMTVESQEFHSHFVGQTGRARIEVTCRAGETWKSLSQRYGVSLGTLERINQKSRRSKLNAGDKVIVYARQQPAAPPVSDPAAIPTEAPAALDAPRDDDAAEPPSDAPAAGDGGANTGPTGGRGQSPTVGATKD